MSCVWLLLIIKRIKKTCQGRICLTSFTAEVKRTNRDLRVAFCHVQLKWTQGADQLKHTTVNYVLTVKSQ